MCPNVYRHIEETLELARRGWAEGAAAKAGARRQQPR
jgi:hypothetical protein